MSTLRYLYGTKELTVLPGRDKTAYPNCLVFYSSERDQTMYCYSDQPFYLDTAQNKVVNTEGSTIYESLYYDETETWSKIVSWTEADARLDPAGVIWCNVDILDDTGAVFLAASAPVLVETRPAPFSLKLYIMGMLNGLLEEQSPICDAKPITGCSYNGVPLPVIPDVELVGHKFAAVYGGTGGKYHLCLFSARPHVLTSDTGEDIGFAVSSWFLTYKIFANYSTEDESMVLSQWLPFETETIPQSGTIDFEITLEDPFVTDGILWTSFDLYGDDEMLRKKASYIYPVSEVIGNG